MKILEILKNSSKILGQNSRNLIFIQGEKTKFGKKIADNKILTKEILIQENIPNPLLLGKIENEKELEAFDWNQLPKSFVMKPVHGSQGAGIEIFYNKDENGNWITTQGERTSLEEIQIKAQEILDGKYSLSGDQDQVFFEERVKTHKALSNFTHKGAPDIRVVIFNQVPVMSYIRFPTKESKGKANMIQGAVGTGIDIASGITTTSTYGKGNGGKGVPIEFVPGTKLRFQGVKIPYWNKILTYACQTLKACQLNFGAVDFLLDNEQGPVVVEINARPGLSIQIVNRDGLKWRLEKIRGLKIKSIEQGIRIGQDLFGGEIEERIERISGKEVISNIMPVNLKFENKELKTIALIDTTRRTSVIDAKTAYDLGIISEIPDEEEYEIESLEIKLGSQTITTNCRIIQKPFKGYKICIGRNALSNFLIDIKKTEKSSEYSLREKTIALLKETDLGEIDKIFLSLSTKLSILPAIRPTNEKEEKEKFFQNNCEYNPKFLYKPLRFNPDQIIEELDSIKTPANEIGDLYYNKISEFKLVTNLLESVGVNDEDFCHYSQKLFGTTSKKYNRIAKKILENANFDYTENHLLDAKEIKRQLMKVLKDNNLDFPIEIRNTESKNNKISIGKITGTIRIYTTCQRNQESTNKVIAHEIYTHLLRLSRGKQNKYKIFQIGTRRYLKTEEGLANLVGLTHTSNKLMIHPSLLYNLIYTANNSDFATVYRKAFSYTQEKDISWNYTMRVKRGLEDTCHKGAFTKDMYLKWTIETAKHILSNPIFVKYAFNGKAHLEELKKYTQPQNNPSNLSLESIRDILKINKLEK
jgi:alpha-L-glutamate ligase-like protein